MLPPCKSIADRVCLLSVGLCPRSAAAAATVDPFFPILSDGPFFFDESFVNLFQKNDLT
jgi:hypothetical protein